MISFLSQLKMGWRQCTMGQVFHCSTQEAEAVGSQWVWGYLNLNSKSGQPEIHNSLNSLKNKQTNKQRKKTRRNSIELLESTQITAETFAFFSYTLQGKIFKMFKHSGLCLTKVQECKRMTGLYIWLCY